MELMVRSKCRAGLAPAGQLEHLNVKIYAKTQIIAADHKLKSISRVAGASPRPTIAYAIRYAKLQFTFYRRRNYGKDHKFYH